MIFYKKIEESESKIPIFTNILSTQLIEFF